MSERSWEQDTVFMPKATEDAALPRETIVVYYVNDPAKKRGEPGRHLAVTKEQADAVKAAGGEAYRQVYEPAPDSLVAHLCRDRRSAAAAKLREVADQLAAGLVERVELYWDDGDDHVSDGCLRRERAAE